MTPLRLVEWAAAALAVACVVALAIEMLKPARRPLVRLDVVDGRGELVATGTYVVGEAPAELRVGDLRVSAAAVK